MPSLDGTLNVVGISLEFMAVVVGGLALPHAQPIRRWLLEHRGPISYLFPILAYLIVWGSFWLLQSTVLSDGFLSIFALVTVSILLVISLLSIGVAVGIWVLEASDESLQRVLLGMVPVFGTGVLLQLIAAATP